MEHTIRADADGIVAELHVSVGQSVDAHTSSSSPLRGVVMTEPASRPCASPTAAGSSATGSRAAREMVEGGPIDVLTGDWLAELTMLILARQRMKHGAGSGYARTFLTQMEQVLGTCLDRGIKVVSNAGGLDPAGAAAALREKADELGLGHVRIAYVEGDDLMPRLDELRAAGETFTNLDTGESLESLRHAAAHGQRLPRRSRHHRGARRPAPTSSSPGASPTPRSSVGPAAWWHGWSYDDAANLDRARRRGGRRPRHRVRRAGDRRQLRVLPEVPGLEHVGFPWAEVAADGSSVIGKHDGTGGLVSVGTVTAQLLYEIGGPAYANPDVTAPLRHRSSSSRSRPTACAISGVRGERAPRRTLKVAMNTLGGFRNTASLVLTGLDIEAKADLALRTVAGVPLAQALSASPQENADASRVPRCASCTSRCCATTGPTPPPTAEAPGRAAHHREGAPTPRPSARRSPRRSSRARSPPTPACSRPRRPAEGTPYGVYWPTTVARRARHADRDPRRRRRATAEIARVPGRPRAVGERRRRRRRRRSRPPSPVDADDPAPTVSATVVGARSGDKGGDGQRRACGCPATGDAARRRRARPRGSSRAGRHRRTPCAGCCPSRRRTTIDVHPLPNLHAVNVVIHGLLGRGVADSTSLDPQAKGLGEQLRARIVDAARSRLARRRGVARDADRPAGARGAGQAAAADRARPAHARQPAARGPHACSRSRGYTATRMADIAKAAGVSHGTVYTWFADKEAVLRALVDDIVTEVFAALAIADEIPDPQQRMLEANRRYLAAYRRHGRMLEVVEEAAATDARYRDALDGVRRDHVARVTRDITRLQQSGARRRRHRRRAWPPARCAPWSRASAGTGTAAASRTTRRTTTTPQWRRSPACGRAASAARRHRGPSDDHQHARARGRSARSCATSSRTRSTRTSTSGRRPASSRRTSCSRSSRRRRARSRVRPGVRRPGRRPLVHARARRGARPRRLRRRADGDRGADRRWPRRRSPASAATS